MLLYRYIQSVNDLTANMVFIVMFISAANMTFLLFAFGIAVNPLEVFLYVLIVAYNTLTLFLYCYYGDHLTSAVLLIHIIY